SAGTYPNKPIKLIVPYPVGGQTDATARVFAQKAEAALGQPIVVENKVGANSQIGTQFVATAPADGTAGTVGPALNRAANQVAAEVASWVGNSTAS
ncbi:MAG TPA: tripartite tricarboxylate transporter substrate-binding protein, partial [Sphingomicrobium sp.]|nr:tripartite tricarboxylate transporter substrate-binding protein [Sphingomicrobium sp.]